MADLIFRLNNTGENSTSPGVERIEFNTGTVPDATGRLVSTTYHASRDINIHPNPRRTLDQIQDSLLGILDVTLAGHMISHATTAIPARFFNWMKDAASLDSTSGNLPFGRFGMTIDSFGANFLDLTPSLLAGYILYDVEIIDAESPRDKVPFIAKFYRNGAI